MRGVPATSRAASADIAGPGIRPGTGGSHGSAGGQVRPTSATSMGAQPLPTSPPPPLPQKPLKMQAIGTSQGAQASQIVPEQTVGVEEVQAFLGRPVEKPKTGEDLRQVMQAERNPELAFRKLMAWVWLGRVEQVVQFLESGDVDPLQVHPGLRSLHASLLFKVGRGSEAMILVEPLQQSKIVVDKVLCATSWSERATAVHMLYKTLAALEQGNEGRYGALFDINGQPLDSAGTQRWKDRVNGLLISFYESAQEYSIATDLCQEAIKNATTDEARAAAILHLARLSLQIGDIEGAGLALERLKTEGLVNESNQVPRELVAGLILYAEASYSRAINVFEQLYNRCKIELQEIHSLDETSGPSTEDMVDGLIDVECPLFVTVSNNLALCYLNTYELARAIETLEDCVRLNPARHLQRSLVFNLCTLYDLAKPKQQSDHSKKILLSLSELYAVSHRFDKAKDLRLT